MRKILTICIMLLVAFATTSQAQNIIKTYSGKIKTPKDLLGRYILSSGEGEVVYFYYENADGERIKHGEFQYRCSEMFVIVGTYKDGRKDGVWTITEYNYNGKDKDKFTVTYKDGALCGPYKGVLYTSDTSPDIICSGSMKNNYFVGNVKIETPNSLGVLVGFFNDSGWAHGVWKIEKNKGIPIKQEREYYEGFLLKVTELDLSSGEKTILFELPQETVNSMKTTFNNADSSLIFEGQRYKRFQNKDLHSDKDSKLFPNSKTVMEIFVGTYYGGAIDDFIPLNNGFAAMKKDHVWYKAKQENEKRIAIEKEEKERRIAEAKRAEDDRIAEAKRAEDDRIAEIERAEQKRINQELDVIRDIAEENNKLIISKYSFKMGSFKDAFMAGYTSSSFRKPAIMNAYIIVLRGMNRDNASSMNEIIEIQKIVLYLVDKKSKKVEKALKGENNNKEIISFFKHEAVGLCK